MSDFKYMAAPLRRGRLALRNRIVHASILTRFAQGEDVTGALLRYHGARAAGGAAMIITEAVNALPLQAGRGAYLNAWSDAGLDGLKRLAGAVRAHDCRILAQLQERGRGNYARVAQSRAVGPSALPDDIAGAVPHPLATDDVEAMILNFAGAARRLEQAGFDGVEISAGHGHLFHQFLSRHSNRREDRFGGDLAGRTAFLSDTIDAVRAAVGSDFVIAVKLPAEDGDPDGIDLAEAERILRRVTAPARIDLVSFAWGAQNRRLHWHVPDGHGPRALYAEKTAGLRTAAGGVPVMALGRIVDPNEGEAILAANDADLIGVGRALIADPAWPVKALSGRAHGIRACVSCNTCWGAIAAASPLVCDANPDLATPDEMADAVGALAPLAPAPRLTPGRRKTVIVGGGVAGLAMAASAARSGDAVTLLHAGRDVGGRAWLAARLPGGDGLQGVYDDDAARAMAAAARIELGVVATLDDILGLSPDRVALATGAASPWPEDDGILADPDIAPPLTDLLRHALGAGRRLGRHLALVDLEDSIWVYRAADFLLAAFERVTILTPHEVPASREPLVVRQGLLERLSMSPITVVPLALVNPDIDEIAEGRLGYRSVLTGERWVIEDVDTLTHAAPRRPRLDRRAPLLAAGLPPVIIGDAFQPRTLLHATCEGRAAGRR